MGRDDRGAPRRSAARGWSARRLGAALLVAACVIGLVAPVGAQSEEEQGSIGIRLLDSPADRADDPRAQRYIVDHVAPGTSLTRRIEVSNTSAESRELALYTGAATVSDGAMQFGEGPAGNDLTRWTTLDTPSIDLASGEVAQPTVTIDVPADAPPGERYGVVWAEVVANPRAGGGITNVSRVGVRIYLSVGEGTEPSSDFTITTLEGRRDEDGKASIVATVENTGGRALDLSGELELTDGPGGLSTDPFDARAGTTIGIGQTAPVAIPLDEAVPAGRWTARLVLRSGTTEREITAEITIPEEDGSSSGPVTARLVDDGGVGWLAPVLIVLAVVVVGGLLLFALLRRRRPPPEPAATET